MGVEQKTLEYLKKEIKSHKEVENIENHGFENFYINNKKIFRIWGICKLKEPENERARAFFTGKGIYQVAQLNFKNKKIIVILITKQYRYGIGISHLSRHFHDRFLKDFILRIKQ